MEQSGRRDSDKVNGIGLCNRCESWITECELEMGYGVCQIGLLFGVPRTGRIWVLFGPVSEQPNLVDLDMGLENWIM